MKRKKPGYWTQRTVLAELAPLTAELGRLPTQKELKAHNRIDLLAAVTKNGGFNKFAGLTGYLPGRRVNGYWTEPKALKEILTIYGQLHRPPTHRDLYSLGRSDLIHAIQQYGGTNHLYQKLNIIPKGCYEAADGHLLESCLECYVDNYLSRAGIPHEVHPIIQPGRKFRADFRVGNYWIEILGYPNIPKYAAYYSRLRKKKALYKQLGLEVRYFEFDDFRAKTLAGIEEIIKRKLPLHSSRPLGTCRSPGAGILPKYYWSYFPRVIDTLKPLVDELGRLPTDTELDRRRHGGLRHAIARYPGGRAGVAAALNCTTMKKSRNYWTRVKTIENLRDFKTQLGRFPKQKDFIAAGRVNLSRAVYKHGSLAEFKTLLGGQQ